MCTRVYRHAHTHMFTHTHTHHFHKCTHSPPQADLHTQHEFTMRVLTPTHHHTLACPLTNVYTHVRAHALPWTASPAWTSTPPHTRTLLLTFTHSHTHVCPFPSTRVRENPLGFELGFGSLHRALWGLSWVRNREFCFGLSSAALPFAGWMVLHLLTSRPLLMHILAASRLSAHISYMRTLLSAGEVDPERLCPLGHPPAK